MFRVGSPVVVLRVSVISHLHPKVFSSSRRLFFFFFFWSEIHQIHPKVGAATHLCNQELILVLMCKNVGPMMSLSMGAVPRFSVTCPSASQTSVLS